MTPALERLVRMLRRAPHIVGVLAFASCLAGAPAGAGIRDMVKSAKDKAVKGAGQKPAPGDAGAVPAFDDRTLELTPGVLDKLLAGLKAGAAFTADRPGLVARQQALDTEIGNLNTRHGEAFAAFTQKRDEQQYCMHDALEERRRQKFEELMQQGLANPASMEKRARLGVSMNEAQIRGDTASVRRIMGELQAMDAPTREDSLAARKKCGAPPPAPPAYLRLQAAQAEMSTVSEKIRTMDFKVREVQLEASDLTEDQMAIAVDRILLYLAAAKRKDTPQGFSPVELDALAARRDALASALGA